MKCRRCQHENPSGSSFCLDCGTRLSPHCRACGKHLPAGSRFCNTCGRPATDGADEQGRLTSPESYTPRHLAERILTSRTALEGERKQVTVLFADLKGSMELLTDRDPEEARKILDPVLEAMMEAVHHYEGTVNQVMGDGIMALFGAPLAHEDHAVRACYAALRMQQRVKTHAETARRVHGASVQIRVGLNSGEVVVRTIGSDLRMDYTAVGQTTHLAARMEQLADPGTIVITPVTLALAEGYVDARSLGPVPVKGLADPMEVHEVTGIGPARSRLQASARRGLTRFVGRDTELEQLRRAQRLAEDGHGQVTAIVGEAGVGKSRLLYEFTRTPRLQSWLILQAAAAPYGRAMSYLPVIDLLKSYVDVQDHDALTEVREKVMRKLHLLGDRLESTLSPILALLDVPPDDAAWEALDPDQRRQLTLQAMRQLLLREARRQPVLLIVEDLHWIDDATQALLDSLVGSLATARLFLLVDYRPGHQHPWGGRTYYSELRLDALRAGGAEEFLNALLGEDSALAPLRDVLVRRGNPLFLEETVRSLVETGALAGERGRYRPTQVVRAMQVPATVQAILAARIDRLPPEHKRLLQTASVIGKDVPFVLLRAIADLPDEALHRGLDGLQTAEFLYQTNLGPSDDYTFKHALTHEVAYGSLLHDRRRVLHARIVDAIEHVHAGRLMEQVDRLAYHAIRGEQWDQALGFLRQTATRALGRSAPREAALSLEQALEALGHLPETPERLEQGIDVRFDLQNALNPLGELERMLGHLRQAETIAERLGDQRRLGRVAAYMTVCLWWKGEMDASIVAGERALRIAITLNDLALEVLACYRLGQVYDVVGRHEAAIEVLSRPVRALQGTQARERFGLAVLPAAMCRSLLSICLASIGRFAEAVSAAEAAIQVAEDVDHQYSRVSPLRNLGYVYMIQGDLDRALPFLERAVSLCHEHGFEVLFPFAAAALGQAYVLAGRRSDAVTLLELARDRAAAMQFRGNEAYVRTILSEAYLASGRLAEAQASVQVGLELARCQHQRGIEANALRIAAEIRCALDPPDFDHAEADYREALGLTGETGMRPLEAHCHAGLSRLSRRVAKEQDAAEHFTIATTMYREMGMTYWLERVEGGDRLRGDRRA